MDISRAVKHAENISNAIKRLPKHVRTPITVNWYAKRILDDAHKELMKKCIPFFNRIVKEIQMTVESFNKKEIEEIKTRKEYVEKKLSEATQCKENDGKKHKIIEEIEELERRGVNHIEKVVLDRQKTKHLIDFLFESPDCNGDGKRALSKFIELTFDKKAGDKTDAYEKILRLL
ncbi:hypothetical protein GINT2_000896 [Glugoides intestinalis]